MAKRLPVSETLRKALNEAPMSRYRVGKLTGLEHAVLSRFARRKSGLRLDAVDVLAEFFGLRLTAERPRASKLGTGKSRAGGK